MRAERIAQALVMSFAEEMKIEWAGFARGRHAPHPSRSPPIQALALRAGHDRQLA
jgi:hypothetical protein